MFVSATNPTHREARSGFPEHGPLWHPVGASLLAGPLLSKKWFS